MKKILSLGLAMMICILPVMTLAEGTVAAAEEKEWDFFDQLREWYQESGAEEFNDGVLEFFTSGAEVAGEAIQQYVEMAENYLREIYPEWDEETAKAWEILTEAAQDTSEKAKEEVTEAWNVVKNWMLETGETMSNGTREILDAIGSAAGVEEAQQDLEKLVKEQESE